jgi:hypothetical protein
MRRSLHLSSRFSSFYPLPRGLTDKFLAVFQDTKLDREHDLEKQRLDNFHKIAGAMDRPLKGDPIMDVREILELQKDGSCPSQSLSIDAAVKMLNHCADSVRSERANVAALIDNQIETALIEIEYNNSRSDEYEYEYVEVSEEVFDIDTLNLHYLRLHLAEQCCDSLARVISPLSTSLISSSITPSERSASVLAAFHDTVTDLRVQHGVLVSLPGLLRRVGLSEVKRKILSERGGSAGTAHDAETHAIRVDEKLLVQCITACLQGSYDDRLVSHLDLFRSFRINIEEHQESLTWKEVEAVIRLVGEYSAITLRQTLISYQTIVNSGITSESNTADKLAPEEAAGNKKEIGGSDVEYSARDTNALDVDKAIQLSMRKKAAADYENVDIPPSNESLESSIDLNDSVPVVLRGFEDRNSIRKEARWVKRHAKVWLLHDFDYMQKWSCSFAWAEKSIPRSVVKNRMDFSGTGVLEGATTASQLIKSQKEHFIELGGFSQHFAASFKAKKLEKFSEVKNKRETLRVGFIFIVACFALDTFIYAA